MCPIVVAATGYTAPWALGTKFLADTGQSADGTFGAYVLREIGGTLFAGLGNSPGNFDGADVISTADGATLTTERVLDEQGVHDFDVNAAELWVAGTDPTPDDWTFGNIYRRTALGAWSKIRTQPNTIHTWGACRDSLGRLHAAVGAHAGDNVTWQGRVMRSTDDGATWAQNVQVNDYRMYDVIEFGARLYATGQTAATAEQLWHSADAGATWTQDAGVTPAHRVRLTPFGSDLLFVENGGARIGVIAPDFSISYKTPPFTIQNWYNVMAVNGSYLYIVAASGSVYRTNDLVTWTAWSYVFGAVSIAAFGADMIVSNSGMSARLWSIAT